MNSAAITSIQNAKVPSMKSLATIAALWTSVQCLYLLMFAIDLKLIPLFTEFVYHRVTCDLVGRFDEHYKEPQTGALMSGVLKLPEATRDLFYDVHHTAAADIFLYVCTLGYYFWVHRRLGAVFAVGSRAAHDRARVRVHDGQRAV